MSPFGYGLVGLTILLAVVVAILLFAVLRFASAAKDARSRLREGGERAFVSGALEEALQRIKAQERAMSARAAASEQLSDQIVANLTAGLLVVSTSGRIEILNPAGRHLLGVPAGPLPGRYDQILGVEPFTVVVGESLSSGQPIVRRTIRIAAASGATPRRHRLAASW